MEIMDNKDEKEKEDDHIVTLEEILTATNVKDTDIEDRDDGAVKEDESEVKSVQMVNLLFRMSLIFPKQGLNLLKVSNLFTTRNTQRIPSLL